MFVCVLESWGSWGTFWQSAGKKGLFSGFRRGKGGGRGLLRDLDRFASEQNGQPLVMTSGWGARIQLVDKITNSVLLPSISIWILGNSKSLLAIALVLANWRQAISYQKSSLVLPTLLVWVSSWPEFVQIKLGKAHLVISKSKIVVVLSTATSHFFLVHLSAKVCSKNAWCAVTWHLHKCTIHLTEYTTHLAPGHIPVQGLSVKGRRYGQLHQRATTPTKSL